VGPAQAVLFDTGAATVTWTWARPPPSTRWPSRPTPTTTYTAWGSLDGSNYRVLGHINVVPNHGLRMRTIETGGVALRYLRVGEGVGDASYSISEVAAYCQKPTPFPAKMRVVDAPPAAGWPRSYWDGHCQRALGSWWLALLVCSSCGGTNGHPRAHQASQGPRHPGPRHPSRTTRAAALGLGRVKEKSGVPFWPRWDWSRFADLLQLRFFPLPQFIHGWGHLSLLHRIEILARTELRSPVRVAWPWPIPSCQRCAAGSSCAR